MWRASGGLLRSPLGKARSRVGIRSRDPEWGVCLLVEQQQEARGLESQVGGNRWAVTGPPEQVLQTGAQMTGIYLLTACRLDIQDHGVCRADSSEAIPLYLVLTSFS